MREPILIEMEGEPVAMAAPQFARIGRGDKAINVAYVPKRQKAYKAALQMLARYRMGGRPHLTGPLEIHVTATRGLLKSFNKRERAAAIAGVLRPTTKPDGDNYLKLACDALSSIVFIDDAQIVEHRASKFYGENPGLSIVIRELEQ